MKKISVYIVLSSARGTGCEHIVKIFFDLNNAEIYMKELSRICCNETFVISKQEVFDSERFVLIEKSQVTC